MKEQLPVEAVLPELIDALGSNSAVVLQAPTGTGKTTRVPPALFEAGLLGEGSLLLLQPRRVAARACARTMSAMRGEELGDTIGYQIRFEKRAGKQTRILVITEGILTRRFAGDPLLEGVSCVILDEFHERSLHTDLTLAFLRELLTLRDDLKLVVMSATLNTAAVSRFLFDCPVISVTARNYPLRIDYLPFPVRKPLGEQVEAGLRALFSDPADDGGHVLVFLAGVPEIRRVLRHLEDRSWSAELVPLHGSLTSQEQDFALAPTRNRRIILATNIAETSLTIEGVSAVIDSGFRKTLTHDPKRGTDRLDLIRISQAGATQRAGRAGRTGPGRAIRLWDQNRHAGLPAEDPPEIQLADLSTCMLAVLDFHGPDLDQFPFFERPPEAALKRALTTLTLLGLLDEGNRLTSRGRRLNALPLHPRFGAILERGAEMGLVEQAAQICALLGERPIGGASADLIAQMNLLGRWQAGDRGLEPASTLRKVAEVSKQLLNQARRLLPRGPRDAGSLLPDDLTLMLLAGFPDRLCKTRAPGQAMLVGGRGVSFTCEPGETGPDLFLALELMEVSTDRVAGKASRILPVKLETVRKVLPLDVSHQAVFEKAREAVSGVRRLCYKDLILEEKQVSTTPPEVLAQVLAEQAALSFATLFRPDKKAAALLFRLRFAARHLAEDNWPDVSEEGLVALLPRLCYGKRRFDELRKIDWKATLLGLLDYKQRLILDKEVPERYQVPSGSMVAIDYESAFDATDAPVLAVRLQEMFGLTDTPRLARGRVAMLCHLLAPNMRPAQVTGDLRSFWGRTYAEVRKELRRRYPKHAWPEDPWTAQPQRGVSRRKS